MEAAAYLAFDIIQLAALLYLTGGLGNPFAFLLLAPVTVSATILSLRSTVGLCALALTCITALALWHQPLPWTAKGLTLPPVFLLGVWIALAVGILFFVIYAWRVAEEARRLSRALSVAQLALSREQQRSAVGGLVAAAAHELGSPLGTIAITAREISHALPENSSLGEDVELLLSETARCRDILAGLARHPQGDQGHPFQRLPIAQLVEVAAEGHDRDGVSLRFDAQVVAEEYSTAPPMVGLGAEILHGLGNLVQNAMQFATNEVLITTRWGDAGISVHVIDDGPGFPQMVLERLGDPYISHRTETGDHMGLGIFIAETLLQRTGAALKFSNRLGGGAEVSIVWPDGIFEPGAYSGQGGADND
jgi:two-component system sensor histidine kinase RegB